MEEAVQTLERKWEELQENALKQPSPGFSFVQFQFIVSSPQNCSYFRVLFEAATFLCNT